MRLSVTKEYLVLGVVPVLPCKVSTCLVVLWIQPCPPSCTGLQLLWLAFRNHSLESRNHLSVRTPECTHSGLALSISLAATLEIDVSFSSSAYFRCFSSAGSLHTLWIGVWMTEVFSCGFLFRYLRIIGYLLLPEAFAAYHVFHRLLVHQNLSV